MNDPIKQISTISDKELMAQTIGNLIESYERILKIIVPMNKLLMPMKIALNYLLEEDRKLKADVARQEEYTYRATEPEKWSETAKQRKAEADRALEIVNEHIRALNG